MIEAVLFDLDGTLFDRDAAVAEVLSRQVRAFSDVISGSRATEFVSRVTELDAHGLGDKRDVYAAIGTEFGFDSTVVERLVASFWAEYPRCCRIGAGVTDTLAELRRRGKRLGIVTNGTAAVQNAAIDALGLRSAVDTIIVSELEGIRKPNPAIFHRAAFSIETDPRHCCFVGDHPAVDIAGAQAAGLQAFWKRTMYWTPAAPVHTIEAISDLLSYIS